MRFTFFFTYLDNDQIFTMSIYFLYDWEKIKVFLWLKKGKKKMWFTIVVTAISYLGINLTKFNEIFMGHHTINGLEVSINKMAILEINL